MPRSSARLKKGRLASASNGAQLRRSLAPNELPPRQIRLTLRPERPRLAYCIVPHSPMNGCGGEDTGISACRSSARWGAVNTCDQQATAAEGYYRLWSIKPGTERQ